MRQEHPFFSRPHIFFGKPAEDEEEFLEDICGLSLGDMQPKYGQDKIGLTFLWIEDPPEDESNYFLE